MPSSESHSRPPPEPCPAPLALDPISRARSPFVPLPQPLPTDRLTNHTFFWAGRNNPRAGRRTGHHLCISCASYLSPADLSDTLSPHLFLAARTGPNEPRVQPSGRHLPPPLWAAVINKVIQPLTSRSASRWEKPCGIQSIGAKWALWPEADRM